jgi:photosystem II stability/assembly factor-like uncharacterized protein
MAQMIQRGSELLHINTQKNDIEYSKDGGRTWHSRYTSSSYGSFIQLASDGQNILATTSKGLYYSKDSGRTWHRR